MKYRVIIQPSAREQMREAYLWIHADSVNAADGWLRGLERAIAIGRHSLR